MPTDGAPRSVLVRCPFCAKLNRVDAARAADRPACGECGKPILLDRPVTVTDADLERTVAESDVPVLVDFHADWCGPCRVMAPILDEIARARVGSMLIGKLDTDRNPSMAFKYAIRGLPTLVMFRGGEEIGRQVGLAHRSQIEQLVEDAIAEPH
ncbi:MAG: thioredoxin [Longimicrobiales bacterium]